jgi:transglutaminase-like putative cysteine protease
MATEQTTQRAQGSRLLLVVALVALAADAAATFGHVYRGTSPGFRLALAAAVATLLAVVLERRHVLLAVMASVAGLVVAVGVLVFPDTLRFGIPTSATLRATTRAWSMIGDTARTEIAPARPLAPLFLAGLTAVWAASFSAHALAARARSPFMALLPLAALLAFPSIVVHNGARPLFVLAFLLGALALLFADSLRRVGQWGPLWIWQEGPHARFGTATTTRGARRLGLVCLGVAIVIPGILPGYRKPALVDVRGATHPVRVAIDPIVDIRPQLLRNDPIQLFTVNASQPTYWRFAALDLYNGRVWNASNLDATGGRTVESGTLASTPPVDRALTKAQLISQVFRFQSLAQEWLPAGYDPIEIEASGTSFRYDPRTSMLVDERFTDSGLMYRVVSRVVTPTFQQLDAIPSLSGRGAAPYMKLPPIPTPIVALAHKLADPEPTPYRKILAIQDYLRTFRYDAHVVAGHDVDYLVDFLTKTKAGYCEQFAGAMGVMLRALGIPARVAVGFTPGQPTGSASTYAVTTQNAHAWVEVLFPTYGWLAFEPTPTRSNPAAASYDFPIVLPGPGSQSGSGPARTCKHSKIGTRIVGDPCESGGSNTQDGGRGSRQGGRPGSTIEGQFGGANVGQSTRRPVSWRFLALEAALLAALFFLLSIPVVKLARRRLALARARGPRARVLAAYGVLADRAADLGLGRVSAETLWEYRTRLRERVRGLDGDFDRLTGLAGRAAYSERAITADQADAATRTSRRAMRMLRGAVSVRRRLVSWFWIDRGRLRRPARA